jgi:hypothetical protein
VRKHHTIQEYEIVDVKLHAFLTLAFREVSGQLHAPLTYTHYISACISIKKIFTGVPYTNVLFEFHYG